MADFVFNIAKGRAGHYSTLPAASDALIVVLLKSTGLEGDDILNNYDDLAALLAASNDECDFTNYARKVSTTNFTAPSLTVDDTANRLDVDIGDITWTTAGGASNNTIGKLLVCYDNDTGAGTDSAIIPLTAHDFAVTTDGSDITAQIASSGFYRAS